VTKLERVRVAGQLACKGRLKHRIQHFSKKKDRRLGKAVSGWEIHSLCEMCVDSDHVFQKRVQWRALEDMKMKLQVTKRREIF
jgi:hypothetical protein